MPHWVIVLLIVAWPVYMVVLSVWIVMQRSEPAATLAWLMALAFLPYVGFLIYYILGPQRIQRSGRRREAAHKAIGARGERKAGDDAHALDRMAQAMTGFPPTTASRVDLMIDGSATYDALVIAIESAQRHVHVEYYIYAGDRTGTRIRDALIERAKAGVKVRMLLDGVGSKLARKFVLPLHEAGVELAFFHPVQWWMTPFSRPKLNMRSHRKIVICDGKIGFTGGINVTDDENESLNPKAFHDLHLRVEGDAVRWLQVAWLEDWHYATEKTISDDGLFAEPAPGSISAQVIPAGPDNDWEPIHRMQVEAIHRAEERVWLATPYFVPSRAALFALEGAAMRAGAEVTVAAVRTPIGARIAGVGLPVVGGPAVAAKPAKGRAIGHGGPVAAIESIDPFRDGMDIVAGVQHELEICGPGVAGGDEAASADRNGGYSSRVACGIGGGQCVCCGGGGVHVYRAPRHGANDWCDGEASGAAHGPGECAGLTELNGAG